MLADLLDVFCHKSHILYITQKQISKACQLFSVHFSKPQKYEMTLLLHSKQCRLKINKLCGQQSWRIFEFKLISSQQQNRPTPWAIAYCATFYSFLLRQKRPQEVHLRVRKPKAKKTVAWNRRRRKKQPTLQRRRGKRRAKKKRSRTQKSKRRSQVRQEAW